MGASAESPNQSKYYYLIVYVEERTSCVARRLKDRKNPSQDQDLVPYYYTVTILG